MTNGRVVGLRGDVSFEKISDHFASMDVQAVLFDPSVVCGRDHLLSALLHAEKAFEEGRNRSHKLVTEVILYAACERQIGRALNLMKPRPGSEGIVVLVIDYDGDLRLGEIGAVEDPSLCDASPEKAEKLKVRMFEGVSVEDAVLEQVASVDLMKQ